MRLHSLLIWNSQTTRLVYCLRLAWNEQKPYCKDQHALATYVDDVVPDALGSYGGKSLHQQSHGESFMATLMNKLKGKGLYILDEPEAALSPNKQLEAISAIHDLVEGGSQFIIATHSPILLAYPSATIYQLSERGIHKIAYEETEHYRVTRDFLNRHQQMIKILTE